MFKHKRRVEFTSENTAWGVTALIVICLSIIFYMFLSKLALITAGLNKVMEILSPIIMGAAIAYVLLPVYNALLRLMEPRFSKKLSPLYANRFAKGLSTLISISILVATVTVLMVMAIPQVINSLVNIANSAPENIGKVTTFITKLLRDNPEVNDMVVKSLDQMEDTFVETIKQHVLPYTGEFITGITIRVISAFGFMLNIVVGLMVCVYILVSKEVFCAQGKKLIYAKLENDTANRVIDDIHNIHRIFSGFISGKILDSCIIGAITMVAMTIMDMPYAVMISVIVGVTNVIPFFGPFIGAIPSAFIILMEDPLKCLYFLIYAFIIQQIDGNIIGPKILGNSTGLPSFWVLFAILLCGGLFGVMGMVLGVPVFATIYFFIGRWINESLMAKGLNPDTKLYYGLHDIEESNEGIKMNYDKDLKFMSEAEEKAKKARDEGKISNKLKKALSKSKQDKNYNGDEKK